MKLEELTSWLNEYLKIAEIEDQSINGLQVEAKNEVEKIGVAVDARIKVFERAKREKVDLIIVHHGLYWKEISPFIAGVMYERVKFLIENNISLYACHLPLDVHEEVGNNVQIIRSLGFKPVDVFDFPSWYCKANISFDELYERVKEKIITKYSTIAPLRLKFYEKVRRLIVGSGGSTHLIFKAKEGDTMLSGEFLHYGKIYAEEKRINVIAAGHYATETFGVLALGRKIEDKFGIPFVFLNEPTGL